MLNDLFSLKGKRALVTGSSRGIGHAIAMLFAEAGAHVIVHGSKASAKLDEALAEARSLGASAEAVSADIGDVDAVKGLIKAVGDVDILVLNASMQHYQTVPDFDPEMFTQDVNANLRSSFLLLQGFLPGMQQRHFGRIISIGSVNQWRPGARLAIYASTKAAQFNLVVNCARAYAADGITVNSISPGVIDTDRNADVLADPVIVEKLRSFIPARRFGSAMDCAGAALLLASPAGAYINGADIAVDGGMKL
ncbi:MAG: SDR family oxidoreductase [Lentisphaeria bacterium]|nr:SDR family oxidoreductase [Lentisphaeria bacterium]